MTHDTETPRAAEVAAVVERLRDGAREWDIAVADEIEMFGEGTEDAIGMAERASMYREAADLLLAQQSALVASEALATRLKGEVECLETWLVGQRERGDFYSDLSDKLRARSTTTTEGSDRG